MTTVNIDKNKWIEITNWCYQHFNLDNWQFKDGPCRIIFKNDSDRVWFALNWSV
jgi:hypothetical protein